ncbi:MAG: MmoB/DmpM family protein [Candidatus Binatia bacterium]
MNGDEAEAVAAVVAETQPDATIEVLSTYISIRAQNRLEVDLPQVSERLGRPYDAPTFLVGLASYTGNINVEDERITVSTELAV